jgi:hypothetical protein
MTIDDVLKLSHAGVSDDVIMSKIAKSGQTFDLSTDEILKLKSSGVSDRVIQAMLGPRPTSEKSTEAATSHETSSDGVAPIEGVKNLVATTPSQSGNRPRVYLESASKGSQWNAARSQSMEMSKDFEKNCPGVRVTINQSVADYTVLLNHIEHGFVRDNQIQIANKEGDLISKTKEGGSINGDVKKACQIISADWAKK